MKRHHIMRVEFHIGWTHLRAECHAPPGSRCRMVCAQGCEEWNYDDHEHSFEPVDYCCVVESLNADDPADAYGSSAHVPLFDGMPITYCWDGDYYTWEPAPLGVGSMDAVVIERRDGHG